MSRTQTALLTVLAMIAFAANSLLCRLALKDAGIDAASFTSIRLASGALVLWFVARARGPAREGSGNWISALSLFAYAIGFSYAYLSLPTGIGALLLFSAVQVTMIGYGLWSGERLRPRQSLGLLLAILGLVGLLLPGLSAPPLRGAALMLSAGCAWGIYSLRGRASGDPTRATADNFLRALPLALVFSAVAMPWATVDPAGLGYAVASGGLASGLGYAVWYTAIKGLRAADAASVQLSVPVLATLGGIVFLGEPLLWRSVLASAAILGGIALVVLGRRPGT